MSFAVTIANGQLPRIWQRRQSGIPISRRSTHIHVSIDEAFVAPGYLGSQYSPLTAEKPHHGFRYSVRGVSLEDGLTVAKYKSQKKLLDDLDTAFRGFESLDDQVQGMDRFSEQA